MKDIDTTSQLPFGINDGHGVRLMEFYEDADSTLWFRPTSEVVSLEGLQRVADSSREHSGRCVDTGEYISRIGEIVFALLQTPPEHATLATFTSQGWCGTRTFGETVDVTFYAPVA